MYEISLSNGKRTHWNCRQIHTDFLSNDFKSVGFGSSQIEPGTLVLLPITCSCAVLPYKKRREKCVRVHLCEHPSTINLSDAIYYVTYKWNSDRNIVYFARETIMHDISLSNGTKASARNMPRNSQRFRIERYQIVWIWQLIDWPRRDTSLCRTSISPRLAEPVFQSARLSIKRVHI